MIHYMHRRLLLIIAFSLSLIVQANDTITFFGSSVCNGQGAKEYVGVKHGYAWQYIEMLNKRHTNDSILPSYIYTNASINGNKTTDLLGRYDRIEDCGQFILIGLGLGNEGLHEATYKQAVYNQWRHNMDSLIHILMNTGKMVVATNNYPRGDYNATDYSYVKKMNLEMHEWDIPTVNFLGALDNCKGDGQWADGYQVSGDIYHPTEAGHTEFMHTVVPSLFDALAAGKAKPARQATDGTSLNTKTQLILTPEDEVHSFTVAFKVAGISNLKLLFGLTEGVDPALPATLPADAGWHTIVISHYYAAGKTFVYLDGIQQSVTDGKLLLSSLKLSGECKLADLHFWRAGMNADEIAAWEEGKMLCSSLELYCPLDNGTLSNLAQSTNQLQLIIDGKKVIR